METSNNNTVKTEIIVDPLDTLLDLEEIEKWSTCGHILIHIQNFNYLIECSICKVRFYDNDLFIKHLHETHNDIFTKDLKMEYETLNVDTVQAKKELCKSRDSEYKLNNDSGSEETSLRQDFEELSDIEKELKLGDKIKENKRKSIFSKSLKSLKKLKTTKLNKRVKKSLQLDQEENEELDEEEFNEDENSLSLRQKTILEKHGIPLKLRIPVNGIYQCSECSCKFKRFRSLKNHFWLKHTYQFKLENENCIPNLPEKSPNPVDNLFHCTACLGSFTQYEALLAHFKYHPGASMIEIKPHKCSRCDSTFWTKVLLRAHEVVHTRERTFVCEICSKGFIRKENLMSHTRIHTNDRRHKCNFCDKMFFEMVHRKRHELVHLGLKPHVCDICGISYRARSLLSVHMRRHTGEKLSICNVCGKSFFDNKQLKEHKLIHSEKQFECQICHKSFTRKTHLKNHEKLHSEERSYICEICNIGFKQNAGLYSHIKNVHGKTKATIVDIH